MRFGWEDLPSTRAFGLPFTTNRRTLILKDRSTLSTKPRRMKPGTRNLNRSQQLIQKEYAHGWRGGPTDKDDKSNAISAFRLLSVGLPRDPWGSHPCSVRVPSVADNLNQPLSRSVEKRWTER